MLSWNMVCNTADSSLLSLSKKLLGIHGRIVFYDFTFKLLFFTRGHHDAELCKLRKLRERCEHIQIHDNICANINSPIIWVPSKHFWRCVKSKYVWTTAYNVYHYWVWPCRSFLLASWRSLHKTYASKGQLNGGTAGSLTFSSAINTFY